MHGDHHTCPNKLVIISWPLMPVMQIIQLELILREIQADTCPCMPIFAVTGSFHHVEISIAFVFHGEGRAARKVSGNLPHLN